MGARVRFLGRVRFIDSKRVSHAAHAIGVFVGCSCGDRHADQLQNVVSAMRNAECDWRLDFACSHGTSTTASVDINPTMLSAVVTSKPPGVQVRCSAANWVADDLFFFGVLNRGAARVTHNRWRDHYMLLASRSVAHSFANNPLLCTTLNTTSPCATKEKGAATPQMA